MVFKERCILIIILHESSQTKLAKVFRVFLVGETVGGDVLRLERDRVIQAGLPLRECLPRDAKHQIDIDVLEPCFAQDRVALFRLRRAMVAAQRFEQAIIPGLHAKAYARNACRAEQLRLLNRHGCRVCLEGPLAKRAQIQSRA